MSALQTATVAIGASLASTTATNILAVGLASRLAGQHRLFDASLVLLATCLPPVFVASRLGGWLDRNGRRRHALLLECAGAALGVASIAAATADDWSVVVYFAMGLRAIAAFGSRACMIRWLKVSTNQARQPVAIKLFQGGVLASVFLAGAIVALGPSNDRLSFILVAVIGAHIVSATLLMLARTDDVEGGAPTPSYRVSLLNGWREILRSAPLRTPALVIVSGQATLQAAEMSLVSLAHRALPSELSASLLQLSAGLGLIVGLLAAVLLPTLLRARRASGGDRNTAVAIIAALSCIGVVITTESAVLGAVAFGGMCALYEYLDVSNAARFFTNADPARVAYLHACLRATSTCAMAIVIAMFGLSCEMIGVPTTAAASVLAALALWTGAWILTAARGQLAGNLGDT